VLMLIARGLSNAAIGQQLHLAESSVKTHVGHLLAKLEQHDRVQLVIYAYETGLIVPSGSHRSAITSPGYGDDTRMRWLEDPSSGST
jgi:regulatory LuxR family protein